MRIRMRILGSKALAILAGGTLALTTFAGDRNPAARPVKVKADLAFLVSLDPATLGEAVGISEGQSAQLGKFVANTAGSYDFETSNFIGEGVLTAASGDLIYFKINSRDGVRFTGGTGRFEDATGGYTIEPTSSPEQRMVDGQLIVTFSYTGQGTLTSASRPSHSYKREVREKRRS